MHTITRSLLICCLLGGLRPAMAKRVTTSAIDQSDLNEEGRHRRLVSLRGTNDEVNDDEEMEEEGEVCVNMCTEEYHPICASDGMSYSNLCYFSNAKCLDDALVIIKDSECIRDTTITAPPATDDCTLKPLDCPDEYTPVCGSDDVTYDNLCLLQFSKCRDPSLHVVSLGECSTQSDEENLSYCTNPCAKEFVPVCGNDGVSYGNKCQLENAACLDSTVELAHVGMCKEAGEAEEEEKDLTGHELQQKKVNAIDRESEWMENDCSISCEMYYAPVCASDGLTYPNACEAEIAKCLDPSLKVLYDGECRDPETSSPTFSPEDSTTTPPPKNCDYTCPEIWEPVCTKDLTVFANKCELIAAQCLDSSIEFLKDGECEAPKNSQSPTQLNANKEDDS